MASMILVWGEGLALWLRSRQGRISKGRGHSGTTVFGLDFVGGGRRVVVYCCC